MTDRIYFPNKKKDRKAKGGAFVRETTAQLPELTEEEYEDERKKLSPIEIQNLQSFARTYIADPNRFKGSSAELQRRIRNEARRILRKQAAEPERLVDVILKAPALSSFEQRILDLKRKNKNELKDIVARLGLEPELKQIAADTGKTYAGLPKSVFSSAIISKEVEDFKKLKKTGITSDLTKELYGSGLKMKKLKQATKTGMALKPQQRKTRLLKLEKEVTEGVDVPKHFHRYIKLMKMHDAEKRMTPRQELHLSKYKDLDGAGFFDKIGDAFKTIGKKVVDVVPKLVEHGEKIVKGVEKGKEIYDKGKKVYDVVKSFKKSSDKK